MTRSERVPSAPSVAFVKIWLAEYVVELPGKAQGKLHNRPGQDTMRYVENLSLDREQN